MSDDQTYIEFPTRPGGPMVRLYPPADLSGVFSVAVVGIDPKELGRYLSRATDGGLDGGFTPAVSCTSPAAQLVLPAELGIVMNALRRMAVRSTIVFDDGEG